MCGFFIVTKKLKLSNEDRAFIGLSLTAPVRTNLLDSTGYAFLKLREERARTWVHAFLEARPSEDANRFYEGNGPSFP